MRIYWLLGALVFASLLSTLHQVALTNHLYWHNQSIDMLAHALGGAAAGTLLIGLFPARRRLLFLGASVIIFAAWELFESAVGLSEIRAINYVLDTSRDVLMDTLGAVAVYIIARITIWKYA